MTKLFPATMDFSGFNAPTRIEADVFDLIVDGEIPRGDHRAMVSHDARPSVSALLHRRYVSVGAMA